MTIRQISYYMAKANERLRTIYGSKEGGSGRSGNPYS
jgi:hypothetical protein